MQYEISTNTNTIAQLYFLYRANAIYDENVSKGMPIETIERNIAALAVNASSAIAAMSVKSTAPTDLKK